MFDIILILTFLSSPSLPDSATVSKIYFQGNHAFKSKLLSKTISSRPKELYDEFYLEKDINNLTLFYQDQGFKDAEASYEVTSSTKGKLIYYKIVEGARTKISDIKMSGNQSFSTKKIQSLLEIKPGDYLITTKLDDAEKIIIQWYKNRGFPFVSIERKISLDNNYASVDFIISEGNIAYIKELKVRGNLKVSDGVILGTTELKTGKKFSLEKLELARQKLYATRLFERVSFYIMDTLSQDSLVVRFDVLEMPIRSVSFGFGIQTPPTRLLASSEWEHLNFLSKGHDLLFSISYAPTFSHDWRGEFKNIYRIYNIFKTPINFTVQPFINYDLTDTVKQTKINIEAGLARYFGLKFNIGTYLRYLRFWSNQALPDSLHSSTTNSQSFFLQYDSRDNFFTPERGLFLSTNLQIAGKIYGGDNNFFKTNTELILFKKILQQFVLAGRIMNGFAIPYNHTPVVPYFEEFSIGGNNGLRGYNEKAIGPDSVNGEHYGEAISNLNIEFRTHFEKLFDFVIFSDIGTVTDRNDFTDINLTNYQYSIGAGIRVNTPFGPIRLDYAKRLKDPPAGDWGKIHLAILNAF
jgi:outer membrane protein assembly complex protein YaeT